MKVEAYQGDDGGYYMRIRDDDGSIVDLWPDGKPELDFERDPKVERAFDTVLKRRIEEQDAAARSR